MSQNIEELTKEQKKFQLNMEILSSLKPLKGKSINLEPESLLHKKEKEDMNKINLYTFEDLYSTSNSIPIKSKNIIQKISYTSNSAFKPISLNQNQNLTQTINYYNLKYNTFMPYPNILFEKQKITNQNLINNFLINQNIFLNSSSTFKNLSINPTYRSDINIKKDNILLNKKRKNENKIIINDEVIKKNNYLKNKIINKKNVFFIIKKDETKNIPKIKISQIKNIFNVYKKNKYIFKKRKKRIKKEINLKNIVMNCGHKGCGGIFKTKKQLIFHHYKMSIDCHNDTISLLKLIFKVKKILLKIDKNDKNEEKNIFEKYSSLYKETMKNISLDEHIDAIVGFNFED